jgi:hypothetical protein
MHRDKVTFFLLIERRGRKAHGFECYSRANNPPDIIVTNKKSYTWICKYVVVRMPQNIGCIKKEIEKKWQKLPNLINLLCRNRDKKLFYPQKN